MSLSPTGETAPLLHKVDVQNGYPEFLNLSPAGEDSPQSDSLPSAVDNKYHLDEIIPPTHTNRTIVLCFDGTGDQFSEDVRTASLSVTKGISQLMCHKILRTPISSSSSPC